MVTAQEAQAQAILSQARVSMVNVTSVNPTEFRGRFCYLCLSLFSIAAISLCLSVVKAQNLGFDLWGVVNIEQRNHYS